MTQNKLDIVCDYAMHFIGKRYQWGGAGPAFDCSGLCIELLNAVGLGPPHDMSAQQIFEYYRPKALWDQKKRGALAFYGRSTGSISHVAFMISEEAIIEAGGGDHFVTTAEIAQVRSAFVRIRMWDHRKDFVASFLLDGFY